MTSKIKSLVLKNFKSIPEASVVFENLTFFVGKNGSGKSNLVDSFAFVSEAMQVPLLTIFRKRAGSSSVAYRIPLDDPISRVAEIPFGIGITLENLDGYSPHGFIQSARAHYAFELILVGNLIEVVREQCIVESEGRRYWFNRSGIDIESSEEFLSRARGPFIAADSLSMPFIGGIPPFYMVQEAISSLRTYSIDPRKLREFQDPDVRQYLLPDGSNATSILDSLARNQRDILTRMIEILGSIVPNISKVRMVRYGPKQSLRFTQDWDEKHSVTFEALNMSDGTLRSFGLLLALFQEKKPSLTIIEEPEASMHPAATNVIVELLQQMSQEAQIIVTTHSPDLLDNAGIAEENLRVVAWEKGRTQIGYIPENARSALKRHLSTPGELLRMRTLETTDLFELPTSPQLTLFREIV